jgi:uncharacterized protein YwgA
MDRQQIGVKLTMDALGLPFSIDRFTDRLVLQKVVYLVQAAGAQLGYQFHWYLRGPYSSLLARDGFGIGAEVANGEDESNQWHLSPESRRRIANVKRLIGKTKQEELPQRLELLASVHFLVDEGQVPPDPDAIDKRLRLFGKDYTPEQVKAALRELSRHGLIASS